MTNHLFGWKFCVVQQTTYHPHQDYEQISYWKKTCFLTLVGPLQTRKLLLIYNWMENGTVKSKIDDFFNQFSESFYDVMQTFGIDSLFKV